MNESIGKELVSLERKVQILLANYAALKENVNLLKKENKKLLEELKFKDETINNFQNQIKISKIVNTIAVEHEKSAELKIKIDEYIKEIDKCIAHLSE